jgi:branched-chain amino acid transport system substrate-binding protein
MAQAAREEGKIVVVPNAGANDLTRKDCMPTLIRSSFSNWQPAYPAGTAALQDGRKTAVIFTWNYPAGFESGGAFKESFTAGGGRILKEIMVDFPQVEFQAGLTDIAALKPDCVYSFFAGAAALKYIYDYAAAGLQGRVPLYGPGFLTDGVYRQAGKVAEGIKTTLHYADDLPSELNRKFRAAFKSGTGRECDVYAVQGYDTGTLLIQALATVKGDPGAQKEILAAMRGAWIDSPRGRFTISKAGNPVQNIYLREVKDGEERLVRTVVEALADPATGCALA